MLGMAAVAEPMIVILIGEKWLPAATYLQIICFAGMLYPLHAINLNILQVKGRSDLFLKLEIIKKMIAVFPILMGIFFGIEYLLIGSVVTSFIAFFLNSRYAEPLINYSTLQQIKDIFPTFIISLTTACIMWGFSFLPWQNGWILFLQISVGIVIAFLLYEKSNLSEYREIKEMALSAIVNLSKKWKIKK
jgi:O-antigen/teichoic acid export membrane protein